VISMRTEDIGVLSVSATSAYRRQRRLDQKLKQGHLLIIVDQ